MENLKDSKSEKSELMESDVSDSADFTTPDSGLDDSENVSPLDKKPVLSPQEILLEMENLTESKEGVKEGVLNILDNLKFNFSPEIVETNLKNLESVGFAESKKTENGPSSPLSPSGLGELRHTRGRLKLDLPFNHNAELGAMITKKINRIH